MGYIRSSALDCHSRTSCSTAPVTRLIRWRAGDVHIAEKQIGRDLQAMEILKMGADVADGQTGSEKPAIS